MNKDAYIDKLKKLLIENKIVNYEKIISKYEKRFSFGLESGLKEKEIISKLGTPEEVVEQIKKEKENTTLFSEKKVEYVKNYNLIIKTVNDDITICESSDDLVHVELNDVDKDAYNIINNNVDGVSITYDKYKFLGLNRRKPGEIIIYIPKDKVFEDVYINTINSDINIDSLKANSIKIKTVSGDFIINELNASEIRFDTVSGDNETNSLECDKFIINTVSGDFNINNLITKSTLIDSVSGDIKIETGDLGETRFYSVSGDLNANGNQYKSFAKMIGDKFKGGK